MQNKTWKFEIHVESEALELNKTFSLEVVCTENEADILLDALISGFEQKGVKVGGGMVEVAGEQT